MVFNKMKKLLIIGGFALALISSFINYSCTGCNRPEPNFEGVLMQNCGKNGLSDFTIVTGSQGPLGPCSELYQVPMYEQKADCDPFEVTSKDGGTFTVDPFYAYEAMDSCGNKIIFNCKHVGPSTSKDRAEEFMNNIETQILSPATVNIYREEARNFSTDSLIKNMATYEMNVDLRLKRDFASRYFKLNTLSSGLKPPKSMVDAIEKKNNVDQQIEQERRQLEISKIQLEKAKIDREKDLVKSQGLTKEILTDKYIDALRNTQNKVIITDGKTPVIIQQ